MRRIFNIFILVFGCFIAQSAFAYCVYNKTSGNDTFEGSSHLRTTLMVVDKVIKQDDYRCDTSGLRDNASKSSVNVFLVSSVLHYADPYTLLPQFIVGEKTLACQVSVYNKGGYVVVTGYKGNFNCAVYQD